jgi:hypothetical protein
LLRIHKKKLTQFNHINQGKRLNENRLVGSILVCYTFAGINLGID